MTILGVRCGVGYGRSKQQASTLAAAQALVNLALSAPADDELEGAAEDMPPRDELLAKLEDAAQFEARSTN